MLGTEGSVAAFSGIANQRITMRVLTRTETPSVRIKAW